MSYRIIWVRLDGAPLPRDCFLVALKEVACVAGDRQPYKQEHVARTEPNGFLDVRFGLVTSVEMKLVQADHRVSECVVSVERDAPFALSDRPLKSFGEAAHQAHGQVRQRMI